MESLNSFVNRKMKLRKTLMIIFSCCSILLLCGILNYVMESGNGTDEISFSNPSFAAGESELKTDVPRKNNPREIIMDRKDKKIRMYSAAALLAVMSASFIIDLIFVRCPVCSGHISYSINPSFCHHCGSSFARKEVQK